MSHSILVVDDDYRIRELLRDMLGLVGFHVVEAIDGVDGLEKLEQYKPDAIVLDVMMPNMDGVSFCKKVRSQQETAELPIVMLSGKTHLNAAEEGLQAGANEYLFKPVSIQQLVGALQKFIK